MLWMVAGWSVFGESSLARLARLRSARMDSACRLSVSKASFATVESAVAAVFAQQRQLPDLLGKLLSTFAHA